MRFLNWVFSRFDGRRAGRVVIAVAMLLTLPGSADVGSPLSYERD